MYTKEHSSYLRILEKGKRSRNKSEFLLLMSQLNVPLTSLSERYHQPRTRLRTPNLRSARLKSIIYAWPVLLTDAYCYE